MSTVLQLHHRLSRKNAPTIVLVHGFLGSSGQWNFIADHFSENYQILRVDLPGHGQSPTSQSYSVADVAVAINSILESLQISKVHFIGHSMGGYVGGAFAKAYSKKLLSLTLVHSCVSDDTAERKEQRDRSLQLLDKFPKAFLSMAITNLFTQEEIQEYEAIIETMKIKAFSIEVPAIKNAIMAMRDRPSNLEAVKNLKTPICYIYGTKDLIIPPSVVRSEIKKLPKTHKAEIPTGHMGILTHPSLIIDKMLLVE